MEVRAMELTRRQIQGVFWLSVLIVPGAAILLGVAALRRRKANA